MRKVLSCALGALVLAVPAGVGFAGNGATRPICHIVAPSADECDRTGAAICQTMTGWQFERIDDQVGQWYSPGDVLQGWSAQEDEPVWSSRACAVKS